MSAEAVTIGILLREPEAYERVYAAGVRAEHFVEAKPRTVIEAMRAAWDDRRFFDVASLALSLPSLATAMIEMMDAAPIALNVEYYAAEVLAAAWQRESLVALNDLTKAFARRRPFDDATTLREASAEVLGRVVRDDSGGRDATAEPPELAAAFVDVLQERVLATRAGKPRGLTTGIKILDRVLAGWIPKTFVVIAARPGVGKTTFATGCHDAATQAGCQSVFFTIEMGEDEIVGKAVSRRSQVNGARIFTGKLEDEHVEAIETATLELSRQGFRVNERAGRRIETLETECRRLRRAGKLDLAFIDYLQLMRADGRWANRNAEVSEISMRLKLLAVELKIPVIALSQLNREAEKASERGKPPSLAHLKDSGSIEQDADVVIFIDVDEMGQRSLIVAKNRHGISGQFRVEANLGENRFSDGNFNHEVTT